MNDSEQIKLIIVSVERQQKQLELLLVAHSQLNSRVGVIEANSAILIERQDEIKDLLEDRRDWLGVKKYTAKIAGLVAGVAAFVGSIYAASGSTYDYYIAKVSSLPFIDIEEESDAISTTYVRIK